MNPKKFQFDLYRLNVVDNETEADGSFISNDQQISATLRAMGNPDRDIEIAARRTRSKWGVRQFETFVTRDNSPEHSVHRVLFARALEEQAGDTLTDDGVSAARSELNPPLAASVSLYFWMHRHLVAVEHNGTLLSGSAWRAAFRRISEESARRVGYQSHFSLEPVPEPGTLLTLLTSFRKLTRLKVKVRIPNPDLTEYTRAIYEELSESRIREYTQEMQNRQDANGINVEQGSRAHRTISLAEDGYKDGDVILVGVRDRGVETVIHGRTAARGTLQITKETMRRLTATDDPLLVGEHIGALLHEINRIKPLDARASHE
jgi:hypothetical protein